MLIRFVHSRNGAADDISSTIDNACFVYSRTDAVAFLDSFSYRLAIKDATHPAMVHQPGTRQGHPRNRVQPLLPENANRGTEMGDM